MMMILFRRRPSITHRILHVSRPNSRINKYFHASPYSLTIKAAVAEQPQPKKEEIESQAIDIRSRLKKDLIASMKAKDTLASTTIKSVIAEVTNADKVGSSPIKNAAIYTLIRKSITRREDASTQYTTASRPDLANKELVEASILKSFLPPPLSEEEIIKHLTEAINQELEVGPRSSSIINLNPGIVQGRVIKAFWNRVQVGTVPSDVVAKKAKELLQSHLAAAASSSST